MSEPSRPDPEDQERSSILSSSAVMAAGTVVSRVSGFVRGALLAAALGAYLHADLFNIANTIPNMLYILLAGGVFNAVLVPQLVRAMKNDPDGGESYTNRIVTLAALFLGFVTVVMVVAAPLLMRVFLDTSFWTADLAEQRDSVIDFARLCLPQVFFYGMFVLLGQVLNARGRFGPMMWAPIANNVISIFVLVVYLFVFGPAAQQDTSAYTTEQEVLLGLGATLGIVVQLLVLLPYLKQAGFTYRPRFDFRGTGLGHTLRLGIWTVLFVVVNQIAYSVVVRLASEGAASGLTGGGDPGTGYTIYSQSFLLVMVPHAVITVSLATAILPRLSARAAEDDLTGVSRSLASTLRTALAVIVPFALLLPLVSRDLANVVYGWGAASEAFPDYALPLALFGVGLVFFTVHFLMLRGVLLAGAHPDGVLGPVCDRRHQHRPRARCDRAHARRRRRVRARRGLPRRLRRRRGPVVRRAPPRPRRAGDPGAGGLPRAPDGRGSGGDRSRVGRPARPRRPVARRRR